MSKIIPIILLLAGCFLLWLLYLNRSSPRIQEVTVVIAAAVIGALFFVTKGELLQKTIHSAYFISNKDQIPLFFIDTPVLGQHYLFQDAIFNNYQKRLSAQKKKISFDFVSDVKPLIDLQSIAILNHLLMFYGNYWYIESGSKELPSFRQGTYHPIENVENDLIKYDKNSLPNSLKQNMFFDDLIGPITLAFPRNTRIYYNFGKEGQHSFCEYRFYKRFSFDIRIKISFSSYIVGLGSVGHYVGLTNIEDRFTSVDDTKVKDYGNIILVITCESKFSRFRAWNPSVVRYKKWTKNLFDDLYSSFDWSICQNEMRNYQQTLSDQKIINKLK